MGFSSCGPVAEWATEGPRQRPGCRVGNRRAKGNGPVAKWATEGPERKSPVAQWATEGPSKRDKAGVRMALAHAAVNGSAAQGGPVPSSRTSYRARHRPPCSPRPQCDELYRRPSSVMLVVDEPEDDKWGLSAPWHLRTRRRSRRTCEHALPSPLSFGFMPRTHPSSSVTAPIEVRVRGAMGARDEP